MANKVVIVSGYSRAILGEHVSKYIDSGWRPVGGMVIYLNED